MLNKIIRFSLHNRILVLLLTAFLIIGGTFVIMNSEIDVFPDLNAHGGGNDRSSGLRT